MILRYQIKKLFNSVGGECFGATKDIIENINKKRTV